MRLWAMIVPQKKGPKITHETRSVRSFAQADGKFPKTSPTGAQVAVEITDCLRYPKLVKQNLLSSRLLMTNQALLRRGRSWGQRRSGFDHFVVTACTVVVESLLISHHRWFFAAFKLHLGNFW